MPDNESKILIIKIDDAQTKLFIHRQSETHTLNMLTWHDTFS